MGDHSDRAVAVVGVAAILPDAPDVGAFWDNVTGGRYSISDVDPDRWDPALYYDADPKAPDKTYSKIGGWVRSFEWDPLAWKLPIPPRVADAMDEVQQWSVNVARGGVARLRLARAAARQGTHGRDPRQRDGRREALSHGAARQLPRVRARPRGITDVRAASAAGPQRDRCGGARSPASEGPRDHRGHDARRAREHHRRPGRQRLRSPRPELRDRRRVRVGLAAMAAAIEGLVERQYDAAITGGLDRNMGASTYVKFCKIGALSATGTRPSTTVPTAS